MNRFKQPSRSAMVATWSASRMLVSVIVGGTIALSSSAAFAKGRPATDAEVQLLRGAMQNRLKDAESARLKDVRLVPSSAEGMETACGLVNAKNSFGGYIGFTAFMGAIAKTEDGEKIAIIIGIDEPGSTAVAVTCQGEGL